MMCQCHAVLQPRKTPGEPSDAYLGLLYPTEDFKVYGCALKTVHLPFQKLLHGQCCLALPCRERPCTPCLG